MSELLLDIKDLSIIYSTEDGVVEALNKANLLTDATAALLGLTSSATVNTALAAAAATW